MKKRIGLSLKFILFISLLIVLVSVILSLFFLRYEEVRIRTNLEKKGILMARNLAYNSEYGVLTGNEANLRNLIEGVIQEEDVVYVIIGDKEGNVLAEIGIVHEISGQKGEKINFNNLKTETALIRLYLSGNNEPVYDIANPIKTIQRKRKKEEIGLDSDEIGKEKHDEKTIGSVHVGVSLRSLNRELKRVKKTIILLTLMGIIAGVLMTIFLVRVVTYPIKQLVQSIKKVSQGELTQHVAIKSRDEIGELADSFNKMTSDLKKAQQQIVKTEKLAAIGQLASGVGHELRTPLASIKNVAFYLGRYVRVTDSEAKEYLSILSQEIKTAEKIISDLLDFSRVTELCKIKVSIEKIIIDVIETLNLDKRVEVEWQISPDANNINADSMKLKQVFLNVLRNSAQAIPEGGKIEISTHRVDNMVCIKVTDNGPGMKEETRKNIFEPLFTTKAKGIGLGMAITKDIIERHNGTIRVESKEKKGTEISILLPR